MRIVCWQTIIMKHHTLFFLKIGKMSQNLSSAAVVICVLMVKYIHQLSLPQSDVWKELYTGTFFKNTKLYHLAKTWIVPLWESVIVLCFVVHYFMSILVFQSSWWGRESWLPCLICLPGVLWWLSGSSSRCHGVVCGSWLWYFLIKLSYYFCCHSLDMYYPDSTDV